MTSPARPRPASGLDRIGPTTRCGTVLSGRLRRLRRPDTAAVLLGRHAYRLGSMTGEKRVPSGMASHQPIAGRTAAMIGVATAAVAIASWWLTGAAAAVPIAVIGSVALVAAATDAATGRIPNGLIVFALSTIAGSWTLVAIVDNRLMAPLLADLAAALVMSGAPALFVVWLVAPRLLGGGDWKLLSVLGSAVGFVAPLGAAVIVMGAFAGGLAVAAVGRRRTVALGPPLAVGYFLAVAAVVLYPELFANWYLAGSR